MVEIATQQIDFSRCNYPPRRHQEVGVKWLLEQPWAFLADEMGAGKTLQVIVAAQLMYEAGWIDRSVVVAPASVRTTWFDPELGELAKHLYLPAMVTEYHARLHQWETGEKGTAKLRWIITNYDFVRIDQYLNLLLKYCSPKTLLVLDESSAVKNPKSLQSKACLALRKKSGRVILLNGTPIDNHVGDLFGQARILDANARHRTGILQCDSPFQFRSRYANMGGWNQKEILGWRDLDDIQKKMAPYVLRRLKKDCLDLPEKLPPTMVSVTLKPETWKIYTSMRDDLIAWLTNESASLAPVAITKIMRLAQITSGFLGGVEELLGFEGEDDLDAPPREKAVEIVGDEKLNAVIERIQLDLDNEPNVKILCWSRFRPEVLRLAEEVKKVFGMEVGTIIGGQKKSERERAIRLLTPETMPEGPAFVSASAGAGGKGLTLVGSHTVYRVSRDYRLSIIQQSDDRVHRIGQNHNVSYTDFIAFGPKGQKTIDHRILASLLGKDTLAHGMTSAWVSALAEE